MSDLLLACIINSGIHRREWLCLYGTEEFKIVRILKEAIYRYVKAFKKVRILYRSMNHHEIAWTLDMNESLVKEYIAIIEEFNKMEEKINGSSS